MQNHPQFNFLKDYGNAFKNLFFFISFVYGSPDKNKHKFLWEALKNELPHDSSPWLIMVDFNVILLANKKKSFSIKGK